MVKRQQVLDDLYSALAEQPFPVRGWHLTLSFGAADKYMYPVHRQGVVEKDEDGVPKEKPPVLFHVQALELILTADFRLEANHELGGQPWECPPQVKADQVIRFANTDGSLEAILDSSKVPPYQERLFYPHRENWNGYVDFFSKKWEKTGKTDPECRWILVQLGGIRDSGNHMLHQSLGRLAHRIEEQIPNYWLLAELAMAGLLNTPKGLEAIEALDRYPVGKGALTIRNFQRPKGAPSETLQ